LNRRIEFTVLDKPRSGDHIWWISDVRRFKKDYPDWSYRYDLISIVEEIVDAVKLRGD
jgi:CDP-paratose 2-epimerase